MTDTIYLKAASEQALQTALATMALWSPPATDSDGSPTGGYSLAGPWGHLDIVGVHYSKVRDASGAVVYTTDEFGNQQPQMALQPNTFLANLVTTQPLTPEVSAIQDHPASPSRVFA